MLRLSNQVTKGVTCPLLVNLCKMGVPKPQVPLKTTATSCTSAGAFVATWTWHEILPSAYPPTCGLVQVSQGSESKAEPGTSRVQAPLPACSPDPPAGPPKQELPPSTKVAASSPCSSKDQLCAWAQKAGHPGKLQLRTSKAASIICCLGQANQHF